MNEKTYTVWHKLRTHKVTGAFFWVAALLYPVALVFLTEFLSVCSLKKMSHDFMIYLPGLLATALLYYMLTLFLKRPWVSALILGVPYLILALCNYYKLQTLNFPLVPSDMLLTKNAGNMLGFVAGMEIPLNIFIGLFLFLCCILVLVLFRRKPFWADSLSFLVASVLLAVFLITTSPHVYRQFLTAFSMEQEDTADQNANFKLHGMIGSFLLNLNQLSLTTIEDYDKDSVSDALSQFKPEENDKEDFVKPDVIVILSEAFWDVNQLTNVSFREDPLLSYHKLAQEGLSGNIVSPVFGGGTVRAEFEVLTGLSVMNLPDGSIPYEQYLDHDIPSLASYFNSYGYRSIGLHTFTKTFYNRENAYPRMGFEAFYGLEDFPYEYESSTEYVPDEYLMDWILEELDDSSDPQFVMAITMENHGPYRYKYSDYDLTVTPKIDMDELSQTLINNLTQGVYKADRALGALTDALRERERPTVVLMFGDHLPYMEAGHAGFVSGGLISQPDSTLWTDEETLKMAACPYLIWANYKTEESTAEYVSPYQLGALLLDYIDAPKDTLTTFLDAMRDVLPVAKSGYIMDTTGKRVRLNSLTAEQESFLSKHYLFTYDRLIRSENYSAD